ncbi:MAG: hypothetical protein OCD76_20970 [Reichenbachiella sp.]
MSKFLSFFISAFVFFSCNSERTDSLISIQNGYLRNQIEEAQTKLKEKVIRTGNSTAGRRFIEIGEQISNRTIELIKTLQQNNNIASPDIEALIQMTKNKYGIIKTDTTFIKTAVNDYSSSRTKKFETSLLLFNLNVIESTRQLLHSNFYDVEFFIPIVISNNFTIKKGETFNGTAILQAKMSAIKYIYEIDDPQTDEGFMEVQSWASSNYDGIIRIKGSETGTHKIKIRTTQKYDDGMERAFEEEFEITVTE